jgi:CO/xanthine dehydrogenase Mo-binding subunit
VELTEDPTKGNALRVKGGDEAGITPSSAVLMNAVMDSLRVRHRAHGHARDPAARVDCNPRRAQRIDQDRIIVRATGG